MVQVTNKEIYNKLCNIEVQVIKTNGRVTLNRWIATTGLSASLIVIGWLFSTLVK